MMRNYLIILFFVSLQSSVFAQDSLRRKNLKPISADCKTAIKILKLNSYGPTIAPKGAGEVAEIRSSKAHDRFSFEKEHNSAWYYFDLPFDGPLSLRVIPKKPSDDYDFLLYKYTDSNFCHDLIKKKIVAVRSNISRTGLGYSEVTGLSGKAKKECVSAGVGDQFSKSIEVKKGERYYLVVDNVYPDGEGHTIEISLEKEIKLSGIVLNENKIAIAGAEVSLEDGRGQEKAKVFTNKSGEYQIEAFIQANQNYNLTITDDSSFIDVKLITADELKKSNYAIRNISSVLPKLKGGKKYPMKGLHFFGNEARLIPQSFSSLTALYKLMQKNKKMIISIEGHVNHPLGVAGNAYWDQQLSEMRANSVYEYLFRKGIEAARMSKKGFSNKFMLYPDPKNSEEEELNRRVEINVISLY